MMIYRECFCEYICDLIDCFDMYNRYLAFLYEVAYLMVFSIDMLKLAKVDRVLRCADR